MKQQPQESFETAQKQRVEHWNLVYVVPVVHCGRSVYATIDGQRHKVYPTGNDQEPWTTNLHRAWFPS